MTRLVSEGQAEISQKPVCRYDKQRQQGRVYCPHLCRWQLGCHIARPYLSEKRRFIKRVGADTVDELIRLRKADDLAHGHERSFEKDLGLFKERVDALRKESPPLRVSDLAVNGHDVLEVLGIEPGPRVGEILNQLLDVVIEKPAHSQKNKLIAIMQGMKEK